MTEIKTAKKKEISRVRIFSILLGLGGVKKNNTITTNYLTINRSPEKLNTQ